MLLINQLSLYVAPKNGILDTFRWRSTEPASYGYSYHYPPEHSETGLRSKTKLPDVKMNERFTLFMVYQEPGGPEVDSIFYQPLQGKQFCYRNGKGSVECKLVAVHHASYSDAPYNWGGVKGLGSPGCREGLIAVGIDCLYLPHGTRKSKEAAFLNCVDIGGGLYSPHSQVQNNIIESYMKQEVSFPS